MSRQAWERLLVCLFLLSQFLVCEESDPAKAEVTCAVASVPVGETAKLTCHVPLEWKDISVEQCRADNKTVYVLNCKRNGKELKCQPHDHRFDFNNVTMVRHGEVDVHIPQAGPYDQAEYRCRVPNLSSERCNFVLDHRCQTPGPPSKRCIFVWEKPAAAPVLNDRLLIAVVVLAVVVLVLVIIIIIIIILLALYFRMRRNKTNRPNGTTTGLAANNTEEGQASRLLKTDTENLRAENDELNARIYGLETHIKTLEAEQKELVETKKDRLETLNKQQNDNSRLKEENETLQQQNRSLTLEMKRLSTEKIQVQEKNKKLSQENKDLRQRDFSNAGAETAFGSTVRSRTKYETQALHDKGRGGQREGREERESDAKVKPAQERADTHVRRPRGKVGTGRGGIYPAHGRSGETFIPMKSVEENPSTKSKKTSLNESNKREESETRDSNQNV